MAFLLFERTVAGAALRPTGASSCLAGHNLLYQEWLAHGFPVDAGWHASTDPLFRILTDGAHDTLSRRLVIDFDPNATWRVGLVELLNVYAYTWGDGQDRPSWTPLMLRLRDVHYEEFDPPIDQARKAVILADLPEPAPDAPDFVEFLYLNGPDRGWNWGEERDDEHGLPARAARNYFRSFV